MRTFLTLMVAGLLLSPLAVGAQEAPVSLDAVAQFLPLHGRIVPLAELHRTIGRTP